MMDRAYRIGYAVGYYGAIIVLALLGFGALALCTATLQGCSIPDVDDINLSECGAVCVGARKLCVTSAKARLHACETLPCKEQAAEFVEDCWSDFADCLLVCVEEAEKVLK